MNGSEHSNRSQLVQFEVPEEVIAGEVQAPDRIKRPE